jgi:signal transduction histidine kinase
MAKRKKTGSAQVESKSPHDRAVLASTLDGIVVTDTNSSTTFVNPAAARMLNLDIEEAIGKPVHELFGHVPKQNPRTIDDALGQLCGDPYTCVQDGEAIAVMLEADSLVIQAWLSPVLTEDGEFQGTVITLRQMSSTAESGYVVSNIAFDVSHELRAPLTAIRGYSEMLLRHASERLEERETHFLQIIQRNSDRLVALVNDLMDIGQINSGQLELDKRPIQLETIIRDVADIIQPICDQRGLHLTVEVEPNVGPVLGDKERLEQVVENLAYNACRYTPPGGGVTLALSSSEDSVRVHVADTGIGIPTQDQPRVFQQFFRLDAPTISEPDRGTGLELPIAKMLIEMHTGQIWLKSEPGKGSAFTFDLPLHADVRARVEAGAERITGEAETPVGGQTVLVVEDDRDVSQLIALQLRQEGYKVIPAERGEEALKLAHSEDIDLITLDIMLPDTTGLDVLRRLKADPETADIPVIIVSVLQPDVDETQLGAADHITKPFALERLLSSIRRTLASKR